MSDRENEWVALLDGEDAERARAAIRDIAAAVRADPGAALPETVPAGTPIAVARDATLAGGSAGEGLFFAYLAKAHARDEDHETMVDFIDKAIDAVAGVQMTDGLYSGFTGIAWTVEHLRDMLLDPDDDDPNEGIDEAVLGRVGTKPWIWDYDLISGLVGLGVYALARLPRPAASACLEQILDRLEETSEARDGGRTWHTPPTRLPEWQREIAPNGYHNLGLAHGVPGVIGLLAGMVAGGVGAERSRALLEAAVTWQLAQRLPEGEIGWFDSWDSGDERKPSRSAWCYGDPGVACAVYLAGEAAGVSEWRESAVAMMQLAIERPTEKAGVKDVGLCHGALGLAHIYNRFFQATGEESFAEAARFWYRHGLDMRRPGEGVAGFLVFHPDADGTAKWESDAGLLTGAAGVGLALLGATTSVEPAWDQMLLTSLPIR